MSAAASISAARRSACRAAPSMIRSTLRPSAAASSAAMCSRSHLPQAKHRENQSHHA
jgi:hypothetical protein